MIRLNRSRLASDLPSNFTGAKLRAKLIALAKARHEHGQDIAFKGKIGDWNKTKFALKRDSRNKCAYCEADTATVAYGDVEHFRPKSKYWWLALCVDNYVYSCQICNQTNKRDRFPTKGPTLKGPKLPIKWPTTDNGLEALVKRLQSPDPVAVTESELLALWASEKPDLLHPYLEDPEPYLAWRVSPTNQEVHLVEPSNADERGRRAVKAAVDYLGLNREEHTRRRFQFYSLLEVFLSIWVNGGQVERQSAAKGVSKMIDAYSSYAGMCRYFARNSGFPVP